MKTLRDQACQDQLAGGLNKRPVRNSLKSNKDDQNMYDRMSIYLDRIGRNCRIQNNENLTFESSV